MVTPEEQQEVLMKPEQVGAHVYVRAFPLTGKHAVVRTTHKLIEEQMKDVDRQLVSHGRAWSQGLYRHIYCQAIDHKLQLVDDTAEKRQSWQDFCDDVVLLCVMRYVLFGKHIPVLIGDLPTEVHFTRKLEEVGGSVLHTVSATRPT